MAARPFTDREVLPYLIVYVALTVVACFFSLPTVNVWDALGVTCSVILAVVGTIYIYRENGGAEGQDFLQRYFAIGWVVALRWLVAIVICSIPFYVTIEVLGATTVATSWYDFLFFAIAEVIVYWRIGHHVRDLSQRSLSQRATGDRPS